MHTLPVFLLFLSVAFAQVAVAAEQPSDSQDTNYLYIEKFIVPAGRSINDALDEGKKWVRAMRRTADFKSVRLYFHHTGPEVAIYIHAEPKSWASIESGFSKVLDELRVTENPFNWGGHSDNIVSEVVVD